MNDVVASIVSIEAQHACSSTASLAENVAAAMKAAATNWMAPGQDEQFRGAVAGLLATAWGGPLCGQVLTVTEGRKVFPVTAHDGEYILTLRADRRGYVAHSEWTWFAFCGRHPEDGA